jgi:DNA-directed RNA polymerase specialized sigma24 family protein
MLSECEQLLLDELSHEERSVFLYHFILRMPQKEMSRNLKLPIKFVNKTVKFLNLQVDFIPLKDKLVESFK